MIFKSIDYNIGNAFDASTGIFTCPHNGLYYFYATAPTRGEHYGNVRIYVNRSTKVHHHVSNHGVQASELNHVSPSGVFKLKKGNTVHIGMEGHFYYASSHCARTYFEGHFVDLL